MSRTAATKPFVFTGSDGATGHYLTPPLTAHDIANLAQGKPLAAPVTLAAPADEPEQRHLQD